MEEKNEKQLSWLMISLIAFNFVWGLGNVVNNFAQPRDCRYYIVAHYFSNLLYPIFINDWTTRFDV